MLYSTKARQVRILAVYLMLTVAVACLPGMAWAGDWTHDGTYGAATVVALPGGQATLTRDGADQQARAITYVPTTGAATTIMRDYGPSGRKATEVENGTLRQHVYGAGLAPLLQVEGDGSLSYQVGPDTISVDASGSATVAHLVTDIKQSTVAVLDTQGQTQQRVAYSTLGQSKGQQQSSNVYVNAGQLSGYEGLTVWQLGTDQLIDNRARVYFPLAGRFLALDMAGKARSYEARGNNWTTRADYDGYMDELVAAIENDRRISVIIGESHKRYTGILTLMVLTDKLKAKNIPFTIYQEENLLINDPRRRLKKLDMNSRVKELVKDVQSLESAADVPTLLNEQLKGKKKGILEQLNKQNPKRAAKMQEQDYEYMFAGSLLWDINSKRADALAESKVAIFFTGSLHLLSLGVEYSDYYTRDEDDGMDLDRLKYITFEHTVHHDIKLSVLQPVTAFDLVRAHNLVGLIPAEDLDEYTQKHSLGLKHMDYSTPSSQNSYQVDLVYRFLISPQALNLYPLLNPVFGLPNKNKDDDEKNDENNPLLQSRGQDAQQGDVSKNNVRKDGAMEEGSKEDQMRHGSCSGCLVQ